MHSIFLRLALMYILYYIICYMLYCNKLYVYNLYLYKCISVTAIKHWPSLRANSSRVFRGIFFSVILFLFPLHYYVNSIIDH